MSSSRRVAAWGLASICSPLSILRARVVTGDSAWPSSALKFRRPTSTLAEEFRGNSARFRAIEQLVRFTILALGGGLPIVVDGRQVGAIGVSGSGASVGPDGARRVDDEAIASAALAGG